MVHTLTQRLQPLTHICQGYKSHTAPFGVRFKVKALEWHQGFANFWHAPIYRYKLLADSKWYHFWPLAAFVGPPRQRDGTYRPPRGNMWCLSLWIHFLNHSWWSLIGYIDSAWIVCLIHLCDNCTGETFPNTPPQAICLTLDLAQVYYRVQSLFTPVQSPFTTAIENSLPRVSGGLVDAGNVSHDETIVNL